MKRSVAKVAMGVVGIASMAMMSSNVAFAAPKAVSLSESGSSLLYPLFNGYWVPAFHKLHPNVRISSASTGSGTGISEAIAGAVNIGASDAYLADSMMQQNQGLVNIPLAVSAQTVMYNVPGISKKVHLKLTGSVLAEIYSGKVVYWNDKAIASLNKGVKLPHHPIVPVYRSDSSGDTFLFTQFLSDTNKAWANTVAYGTSVSWPAVKVAIGAKGNSGIVDTLHQTPYSVSYVGISYKDEAVKEGIGQAALQNRAHRFVLPTNGTIQAAVNAQVKKVRSDERLSLIDGPGKNSYPILNFEYAIINTHQPDATTASTLRQFLNWCIDGKWGGNKPAYLAPMHFLPLPASIKKLSTAQINKIQ